MKAEELILFRNIMQNTVLFDLSLCTELREGMDVVSEELREGLSGCVHDLLAYGAENGYCGNLIQILFTEQLVRDENPFSLFYENRNGSDGKELPARDSLYEAALYDMERIAFWYHFDFAHFAGWTDMPSIRYVLDFRTTPERSDIFSHGIRDAIAALSLQLASAKDAASMLKHLSAFYATCGAGTLGLHKAFRVTEKEKGTRIVPIRNIRHVKLSDLVGYEDAKHALVENTEAFLNGQGANNCLLYGDAGTGKSTSIKAIANEYFSRGLRVIELYKHQAHLLHDIIALIKNRRYHFIIYMDDLSFEDFETEYKYLKAVIEGGLEKKPDHVLIYATSNRRHLIRESFRDKPAILDEDIHRGDTVQEKLSLAYRFGRIIYFGSPAKEEYEEIVRVLAKREGLDMTEDELLREATRFEMTHGGRNGRTATQLIEYLKGRTD